MNRETILEAVRSLPTFAARDEIVRFLADEATRFRFLLVDRDKFEMEMKWKREDRRGLLFLNDKFCDNTKGDDLPVGVGIFGHGTHVVDVMLAGDTIAAIASRIVRLVDDTARTDASANVKRTWSGTVHFFDFELRLFAPAFRFAWGGVPVVLPCDVTLGPDIDARRHEVLWCLAHGTLPEKWRIDVVASLSPRFDPGPLIVTEVAILEARAIAVETSAPLAVRCAAYFWRSCEFAEYHAPLDFMRRRFYETLVLFPTAERR